MRNPVRRSKKIGLTQGGRVKDGKPSEKFSRMFPYDIWEKIFNENLKWQFMHQNPSSNYYHPCGEKDYLEVLNSLPDELTKDINAIILTKLSKIDEKLGIEARRRYCSILMNAFPINNQFQISKPVEEKIIRHYEPWCSNIMNHEKTVKFIWKKSEVKKYYMYHVFLHEIGHINQPNYHSLKKREEFAENFALEWARKLGKLKK